jgi:hypothetical protein
VCLAFVAFHDRKLVRYLVMVAAAALCHTSAIIFLALAPFVRLRLTRVTVAIAVALVLPGMYSIFAESAEFYTDRYIGTGIDAAGGLYRAAMLAVVGVFFLLALRRVFKERFPADYQLTLIGAWIMLGTLAILPLSTVMSDRFGYYVTPIQLMILAQLPQLVPSGPQRLLIRTAPYVALGIVLVIWTTHSTLFHQCFLPYQTWLSWRG